MAPCDASSSSQGKSGQSSRFDIPTRFATALVCLGGTFPFFSHRVMACGGCSQARAIAACDPAFFTASLTGLGFFFALIREVNTLFTSGVNRMLFDGLGWVRNHQQMVDTESHEPTASEKAAFKARFLEMLRTCGLDRATFERVANLNNKQIITGWYSRARVGSKSERQIVQATGVSMDWLQRNIPPAFPNGPIVYINGLPQKAQNVLSITERIASGHGARRTEEPKSATGVNVELLAFILEQAATLRGWSAAERAAAAAFVYDQAVQEERRPTKATVLRLLRSA